MGENASKPKTFNALRHAFACARPISRNSTNSRNIPTFHSLTTTTPLLLTQPPPSSLLMLLLLSCVRVRARVLVEAVGSAATTTLTFLYFFFYPNFSQA